MTVQRIPRGQLPLAGYGRVGTLMITYTFRSGEFMNDHSPSCL